MDFFKCCFPKNKESITLNDEFSFQNQNNHSDSKFIINHQLDSPSFTKSHLKNENENFEEKTLENLQSNKIFLQKPVKNSIKSTDDNSPNENQQTNKNIFRPIENHEDGVKRNIENSVKFQIEEKSRNKFEETSLFDFSPSSNEIREDEINNYPQLLIKELEGDIMKGSTLNINANGLVGGMRGSKDGIVFFGASLKSGDAIINDYVLPFGSKNTSHIFLIYYKREINKYYLRSYKEKESTNFPVVLVKLNQEIVLKKKQIFKIGDFYFQTSIEGKNLEIIKLETKEKEREKYVFNSDESQLITIGRNNKCSIPYPNEKSFSRIHTTITFDQFWKVKDGSESPSTNGTWLYAQNSYEIQNETIFRAYSSIFQIFVKNNL